MTKPKAVLPPGEDLKAKKPRLKKSDAGNAAGSEKSFIGQEVHGIVDGSFDAGYLLTVKVGDSPLVFRGLVFEPGMLAPLSKANDIAPGIPATTRNQQVQFPTSVEAPASCTRGFATGKESVKLETDQSPAAEKENVLEGGQSNLEMAPGVQQGNVQQCTVTPVKDAREADSLGDLDVVSIRAEEGGYYQVVESASDLPVTPCSPLVNLNVEVQEFREQNTADAEEQLPDL